MFQHMRYNPKLVKPAVTDIPNIDELDISTEVLHNHNAQIKQVGAVLGLVLTTKKNVSGKRPNKAKLQHTMNSIRASFSKTKVSMYKDIVKELSGPTINISNVLDKLAKYIESVVTELKSGQYDKKEMRDAISNVYRARYLAVLLARAY